MATHKSAKKRSRQNLRRNEVNKSIISEIKTNKNKFEASLSAKDVQASTQNLSLLNSSLAKASKRGIIKKQHMARKLSSFSYKIKKII